jgi:hypothetical protein
MIAISASEVERLHRATYAYGDLALAHSLASRYEQGFTDEDWRDLDAHLLVTREQVGRNPEQWQPWRKLRSAFDPAPSTPGEEGA